MTAAPLSLLLFLSLLFFLVCVPLLLGAASRRCLAALRPGRSVLDGISRVQPMFMFCLVLSLTSFRITCSRALFAFVRESRLGGKTGNGIHDGTGEGVGLGAKG